MNNDSLPYLGQGPVVRLDPEAARLELLHDPTFSDDQTVNSVPLRKMREDARKDAGAKGETFAPAQVVEAPAATPVGVSAPPEQPIAEPPMPTVEAEFDFVNYSVAGPVVRTDTDNEGVFGLFLPSGSTLATIRLKPEAVCGITVDGKKVGTCALLLTLAQHNMYGRNGKLLLFTRSDP